MPSNADALRSVTDIPTEEETTTQLDVLCAHASFKGDKRGFLLCFLVQQKFDGRYRGPFSLGNRPTGKQIMFEFYKDWGRDAGEREPKDADETEIAGKKLIAELAEKLEKYYEKATDRVLIRIDRGRNTGYEPIIAYRGDPRLKAPQEARTQRPMSSLEDSERPGSVVECRCLGNDREAMRYVLQRYKSDGKRSPGLVGLRDTHVRAEIPMRYREDYGELQEAFAEFLRIGEPELTLCTLIFGWEVDTNYVRMVQTAARECGDKLKCYRLRSGGPLMSFILMDYEDLTTEVLFGWGQGKPGKPGAVFSSCDPRMIDEFNSFYEALLVASDRIQVESLLPEKSQSAR